jgi:hypothetical protein
MNQNRGLPVVENDLIITKDAITLELNGDLKVNSNGKKGLLVKQVSDMTKWSDIEYKRKNSKI